MKGLKQFTPLQHKEFFTGKVLEVVGVKPWLDYDTKAPLGTRVELAIIEDHTHYEPKPDISNRYEKFTVKVIEPTTVSIGTIAKIEDISEAKTWGDSWNEQISITAKRVVPDISIKKGV